MQINSNLTPDNLEALRKAILSENALADNHFGDFRFSCTAKNLKDNSVSYLIKFELEEDPDQRLIVSSNQPLPYVATLLAAPSADYSSRANLNRRFPRSSTYIGKAFEDYRTYLNLTNLEGPKPKPIQPTVVSSLRKTLYLAISLASISSILSAGVLWKLFLN